MSAKPLVSCIIIFLNQEQFIQEAIDSVFAQTYDNWELFLVDDGSTDGSTEIARQYAQQFPEKVRYLEHDGHQNLGKSASRNLGINNAKGEYISYLDGDDVWLPHKLERQVEILESQPEAVMVYGPLQCWYSWTGKPEDQQRDRLYGVGANGVHPYSNTLVKPPKLLTLFLINEEFIPSSILVQREILERIGGAEEIFDNSYEDAVVLVKICLTSTVFVSSECWYKYRQHPNGTSYISWLKGEAEAEQLFYLNWVEEYFSQQGVKDPQVWWTLRRALLPHRYPWIKLVKEISQRILPVPLRDWLKACVKT